MKGLHILIIHKKSIPAKKYGGTQRDIWYLGKELVSMGNKVTFLVGAGSKCNFADIKTFRPDLPLEKQIPDSIDLVHSHIPVWEPLSKPYMVTLHGNIHTERPLDINTSFVSKDHARRYGSEVYVYNGLGLEEYGKPRFDIERNYVHFLGKAGWLVKNLKGCIEISRESHNRLRVLGGLRINLNMGFKIYTDRHVRFEGMVGGDKKNRLINGSKALLFPVLWNEPMGLAIIESLYFGCPVFGTPYGSLPELVKPEFGFLSNKKSEIVEALLHVDHYNRKKCHEYICDTFSSKHMALNFIPLYEKVLNGITLNKDQPKKTDASKNSTFPFYD